MAAAHKKANKTADNAAKLYRRFAAAAAPLDAFAWKLMDGVGKAMRYGLADAVADAACADALARDTRIYEGYTALAAAYEGIINQCGGAAADGEIRSCLAARLRVTDTNGESPVLAEKKGIVSRCIKLAAAAFDADWNRFCMAQKRDFVCNTRAVMFDGGGAAALAERFDTVTETAWALGFDALYALYVDTSARVADCVLDFGNRRCVSFYTALLAEEREVLTALVDFPGASQAVADALSTALSRLEADIEQNEPNVEACAACLDKDAFDAAITNVVNERAFPQDSASVYEAFESRRAAFLGALAAVLREIAANAATGFDANGAILAYRRLQNTHKQLADEVSDVFAGLHAAYAVNATALAAAACAEVTQGVAETLAIKVESLAESGTAFMEDMDGLLDRLLAEPPAAAFDEAAYLADCTKIVLTALLPPVREDRRGVAAARQALADCEAHERLATAQDALIRGWNRNTETVNKKLTAFKKEHVLFECCTFEEILHYSVSRLREAEDAEVAAFVSAIDAGMARLSGILARHGIAKIQPAPHEPFNGREHDVLMAEPHEGFKKGEIVKLVNSGYRQNDIVLIRANVIAAK